MQPPEPSSSPVPQALSAFMGRWPGLMPLVRAVVLAWAAQAVFVAVYIEAVAEPACRRHATQVVAVHEGLYWAGGRGGTGPHFLIGHCSYRTGAVAGQPDSGRLQRVSLWAVLGWAMLPGVLVKPWAWALTAILTVWLMALHTWRNESQPR